MSGWTCHCEKFMDSIEIKKKIYEEIIIAMAN
jgi:hypothetical protein